MKQMSHTLNALALLLSFTKSSFAEETNTYPSIMHSFAANGAIVQQLPTAHGLKSYLVTKGDSRQTVYLSPDEKSVIAGMMFDINMNSITRAQLSTILPVIDTEETTFDKLYSRTTGFLVGTGDTPNIVVFADPLCSECIRFWKTSAAAIQNGSLTFYVVPIGVINERQSTQIAATLLSSQEPAIEWLKFAGSKQLPENIPVSNEMISVIEQNNLAFFQYGFDRTPSFGFVTDKGVLKLENGVPKGLYNNLQEIGRH